MIFELIWMECDFTVPASFASSCRTRTSLSAALPCRLDAMRILFLFAGVELECDTAEDVECVELSEVCESERFSGLPAALDPPSDFVLSFNFLNICQSKITSYIPWFRNSSQYVRLMPTNVERFRQMSRDVLKCRQVWIIIVESRQMSSNWVK